MCSIAVVIIEETGLKGKTAFCRLFRLTVMRGCYSLRADMNGMSSIVTPVVAVVLLGLRGLTRGLVRAGCVTVGRASHS